jgi:hypothetical protein
VLKVGAPLVFSITHPCYDLIDDGGEQPLLVRRSYFDSSLVEHERDGIPFAEHHHTLSELYLGLVRSSYRVDVMLEPEPTPSGPRSHLWRDTFRYLPRTLVVRARKEGN